MKNFSKICCFALGLSLFGIIGFANKTDVCAETQKVDITLQYANQSKYFGYVIPNANFVFSQSYYDQMQGYIDDGYVGYTPLTQPMYSSYTFQDLITFNSEGNSQNANAGTYDIKIVLSQTAIELATSSVITDKNSDGQIDVQDVVYDFNQISDFNLTLQTSTLTVVPQIVEVEIKNLSKTYLSALHNFELFDYYTVTQQKTEWNSSIYFDNSVVEPIGHLDLVVVNNLTENATEVTKDQYVGQYFIVVKETENSSTFSKNYSFTKPYGNYSITQNPTLTYQILDELSFNDITYGQTLNDVFDITTPVHISLNATVFTSYDRNGNSVGIAQESYDDVTTFLQWSSVYETADNPAHKYIPNIYESAKDGLELVLAGNKNSFKVYGVNNDVANAILPETTDANYPEYTFNFSKEEVDFMPNIFLEVSNFDEIIEINQSSTFAFTDISFENKTSFFVKYEELNITSTLKFYQLVPITKDVDFQTLLTTNPNFEKIINTANYEIDMKEYNEIITKLNNDITSLTQALNTLDESTVLDLSNTKTQLENLIETQIQNVKTDINSNTTQLTELEAYYSSLNNTTRSSIATINTNIEALANQLAGIQDETVQGSLANLVQSEITKCANLSNSVNDFANQLSTVQMELNVLTQRIYDLEKSLGDISSLKDQTVMSKISALETFATWTKIVALVLAVGIGAKIVATNIIRRNLKK